jgi:hypothetical protein
MSGLQITCRSRDSVLTVSESSPDGMMLGFQFGNPG